MERRRSAFPFGCNRGVETAGVNVKAVSEWLGHEGGEITLKVCNHALPTMRQGAADKPDSIFAPPARAAEGGAG